MHILVTGGSRGIGAAVCRLAGARGWDVSLSYQSDAEAAAAVVAAVEAAGGRAMAQRADAASEADGLALFAAAAAAFGPLDGVVANAGMAPPASRLADRDAADLRRLIDVNTVGALLTAREAVRAMSTARGGRGGSLVLVSSAATRIGSPGEFVDYAASKGAVDVLAIGLAREVGAEGVRVNSVRPGVTETDIHASMGDPERGARLGATTPMGRAGEPEEIAEAILFLLTPQASYVTGAILDVTGGR